MWEKRILIQMAAFVSIVFLIFVASVFYEFSTSCHAAGCSGQICTSGFDSQITTCEWDPEYGCNRDCKLRESGCDFDREFQQKCVSCIRDCESKFRYNSRSDYEKLEEECVEGCYNS